MKKIVTIAFFGLLVVSVSAQEKSDKIYKVTIKNEGLAEYQNGMKYFENNEFKEAYQLFDKAAQMGNANGMFMLGSLYNNGKGVAQDYTKAMEWYKKAADKNHEVAMFNIATMYMNGEGVAKNEAQAFEWAEKAASNGHVQSMLNLAIDAYEKKDYSKLFYWMNKAAEAGHGEAMSNLAQMYEQGVGAAKDEAKAKEWYLKSAEAGFIPSMTRVAWAAYDVEDYKTALAWFLKAVDAGDAESMVIAGTFYSNAVGVEKNISEAYKLWLKAAELNHPSAFYNIGGLYDDGMVTGTKADAAEWYKKAARFGHEKAAARLKELGY